MNTGVYDKQAKAVINKKLRDVGKRLSAYCMQVVSVTASDMGHAMSEEARKKIHYSPDADLIATLSAASLQSYRSWEDRTSAGDVLARCFERHASGQPSRAGILHPHPVLQRFEFRIF